MKRILAATTATLVATSMLASPVLAGGLGGSVSGSGGVSAGAGGVSVGGEAVGGASGGVSAGAGGIGVDAGGTAAGSVSGDVDADAGEANVDVNGGTAGTAAGAATADIDEGASSAATTDLGTEASGGASASFGRAVSSIRANKTAAADLDAVTGETAVSIVSLDAIAKGNNAVAIENALAGNAGALAELQGSIASNATLAAALDAENVDVSSVVAAEVNADGSVTVFTR